MKDDIRCPQCGRGTVNEGSCVMCYACSWGGYR